MKTAAEILFESRYGNAARPDANDPVLTNYYALLKRELTKRQRGFVLSIIDRMGLFIELESRRYFEEGLRLGLSLSRLDSAWDEER